MLVDQIPDECDVCIIGSGPCGLAVAMRLCELGKSVVVLERGGERPATTLPAATHTFDAARHAEPHLASCRAIGGSSWWWGGRCVPFDRIDLDQRPHANSAEWPISYRELESWHNEAADFLGIQAFRSPNLNARDVESETYEYWTATRNVANLHSQFIRRSRRIHLIPHAVAIEIVPHPSQLARIGQILISHKGKARTLRPNVVILAAGGLETTRMLLTLRARYLPNLAGGDSGALGRYYAGHISGKISKIAFSRPEDASRFDFHLERGNYVRRRFALLPATQKSLQLRNIAFWIDNPPFHDPRHGSGLLSAVWLALAIKPIGSRLVAEGIRQAHVGSSPHRLFSHLGNIVLGLPSLTRGALTIIAMRYIRKPPKPGFLLHPRHGQYSVHYHSEQAPNKDSRVTLSSSLDEFDLPLLDIDLRFSESDAESVVRAHYALDSELTRRGMGRIIYDDESVPSRLASVKAQAKDGFHQTGTTRMAARSQDGVVDLNCKVFGLDNLYVASTSVLPSSSQANPTFTAVALAIRLAAHLAHGGV